MNKYLLIKSLYSKYALIIYKSECSFVGLSLSYMKLRELFIENLRHIFFIC